MRSHHAQARAFKVPVYLKPNLIGELTESKQPGMVLPQEQPRKMRAVARNLELAKQALSKKRATAAKELLSAGARVGVREAHEKRTTRRPGSP